MSNADLADFATKSKGYLRVGSPRTVVLAAAWGIVLSLMIFAVPRFMDVFEDFGIEASWAAWVIFRASLYWPVLVVGVVALLVINHFVVTGLSTWKDRDGSIFAWLCLMFSLPMVSLSLLVAVIGTCMLGLIQRLSG